MQIFIYCKATLHVSGVTAPIIRSIRKLYPQPPVQVIKLVLTRICIKIFKLTALIRMTQTAAQISISYTDPDDNCIQSVSFSDFFQIPDTFVRNRPLLLREYR